MDKIYKVAIVGGGASGLFCALELLTGKNSLSADDFILLEKNDRVGKKIVATGNGQCNITNSSIFRENFYGDEDFLNAFYKKLKEFSLEDYLKDYGIYLKTDQEGRKYPISMSANSFLDIILEYLKEKSCNIVTKEKIISIKKQNDIFVLNSENNIYKAQNVVLCVGGSCGSQFGTDGTSYSLALNFNHKLSKLYPSLVQLKTDTTKIKSLKGIKEKAKVTAISSGKKLISSVGDLLFTEYGVSGSTIFKISSCIVDKDDKNLLIEFLPELSLEEITDMLEKRKKLKIYDGEKIFWGLINKRLSSVIYKTAKSDSAKDLAIAVKNFNLKVVGTLGFNYAQVTKGGIVATDVNPFTMQSKKQKGIYIAGEMLNVDGDCGGYNLTFAISSGVFCAKSIKEV